MGRYPGRYCGGASRWRVTSIESCRMRRTVTTSSGVDHDVPRCPNDPGLCSGSLSAVPQVVDCTAGSDIVAFHRSNTLPVMSKVAECGGNESLITAAGGRPEGHCGPIEQSSDVAFGGFRQPETRHSLSSRSLPSSDTEICEVSRNSPTSRSRYRHAPGRPRPPGSPFEGAAVSAHPPDDDAPEGAGPRARPHSRSDSARSKRWSRQSDRAGPSGLFPGWHVDLAPRVGKLRHSMDFVAR